MTDPFNYVLIWSICLATSVFSTTKLNNLDAPAKSTADTKRESVISIKSINKPKKPFVFYIFNSACKRLNVMKEAN